MTVDQPLMHFSLLFVFFDSFLFMLFYFWKLWKGTRRKKEAQLWSPSCLWSRSWVTDWLLGKGAQERECANGNFVRDFSRSGFSFTT